MSTQNITFTEQVQFTTINCGRCGATYAINERYRADRARDGGGWHCPYCQVSWGYSENYENARLKRELAAKQKEATAAKCEALRQQQMRETEQLERIKAQRKLKRVHNGVCPCCKRSFSNLQRHMETKHKTNA